MNEDKSKLQLIGEIAQANNKNLELIVELNNKEEEIERLGNELQVQIEDNVRLNEYIEEKEKEIERLNNIIKDIDRYIHNFKLEDIGEKTMLILNDILLIKNGMGNEVVRLNGSDKE